MSIFNYRLSQDGDDLMSMANKVYKNNNYCYNYT